MKNHNNGRNLNKLTNDVILVASKICFKVLSKYFYANKNLIKFTPPPPLHPVPLRKIFRALINFYSP